MFHGWASYDGVARRLPTIYIRCIDFNRDGVLVIESRLLKIYLGQGISLTKLCV